jgi:ABC-2 type transport system permease protein
VPMYAIAAREVGSMFRMPVGWVVMALFCFVTGLVFVTSTLIPSQPASMRSFFGLAGWLLLPVTPAITMRCFSEEYRTGTIESLLTSPVSEVAVVIGKYLGSVAFLLLMLVPSLGLLLILIGVSTPRPDAGPILAGYLCLLLLGMLYVAIGLLVSSLTSNQTLAYLGTLFSLLLILLLPAVPLEQAPDWMGHLISAISVHTRAADFSRGLIDTGHVVFFVSGSCFFVAMTWSILLARRWQ